MFVITTSPSLLRVFKCVFEMWKGGRAAGSGGDNDTTGRYSSQGTAS